LGACRPWRRPFFHQSSADLRRLGHLDQVDWVECQNPFGVTGRHQANRRHGRRTPDSCRLCCGAASAAAGHVWTAPGWQELSSRVQQWSEQPCVRPVSAVHVTAGHNALRGSDPGQYHAFDNALARVGCPDRRIDRLCITCCLPSQPFTSRRMPDAMSFMPRVRQVPCSALPSSSSPRPCERPCWRARWRRPWLAAAPAMPRAMVDAWCRGAWHSGSRRARRR